MVETKRGREERKRKCRREGRILNVIFSYCQNLN
jgi:hypothetical protein